MKKNSVTVWYDKKIQTMYLVGYNKEQVSLLKKQILAGKFYLEQDPSYKAHVLNIQTYIAPYVAGLHKCVVY